MEPELIADYACVVGEAPLWHPFEKRLYWTDIDTGRLFRYDPATGQHENFYKGDPVGGFTIQADGALLLFGSRGSVRIWREGALETIIEEVPEERESRFNDVIADPAGRVFCGTMPTTERYGNLYRLGRDGTLSKLLEGIGCSNGMGFTPDCKQMYFFDYDEATGNLANQRLFIRTPENEGFPDGMTVDVEGYVWSAKWDGHCLVRYSPDGEEERRIFFPVPKVSSLTFGGDDLTEIYVTSAGGDKKHTEGAAAGALFRINVGIRGKPEFFSRIGL
jgi:sugar lactone lactonase YvrE